MLEFGQDIAGTVGGVGGSFGGTVAAGARVRRTVEPLPPEVIDREMIGDRVDPGAETARVAQGVERPQAGDAGLLEEVCAFVRIQPGPGPYRDDETAVSLEEGPPGGVVAAPQALHVLELIHGAVLRLQPGALTNRPRDRYTP